MGRVRAGYDSRIWHGRLEQIVEIRQGRRKQIVAVGDIDVTRDFTNVHDVVNAYFGVAPVGLAGRGLQRMLQARGFDPCGA